MIRRTKLLVLCLGILAVLIAGVPWLIPVSGFIPQIEAIASERLGARVTVGELRVALLPLPHATAEDITIGGSQGRIGRIRVWPALLDLFSETKVMREVRLDDVLVSEELAGRLIALPKAEGPRRARVERLLLTNAELRLHAASLSDLSVDAELDEDGRFARVRIDAAGKLRIDARPQERNGWTLQIAARSWTPPLGPKVLFDRIDATAKLGAQGLETRDLATRLYGGRAAGALSVAWKPMWTVSGNLEVEAVRLQPLGSMLTGNRNVSGRLSGRPRFQLQGRHAADLVPSLQLASDFVIEDGTLHKVDLVAVARNPLAKASAGETRFDELSGHLDIDPQGYHFSKLRVASGLLRARGDVSVGRDQRLDGRIDAELRGTASLLSVPLSVTGTVQEPSVAPTKTAVAGAVAGSMLLPGIGTAIGIKAGQLTDRLFSRRREPVLPQSAPAPAASGR
jgi:hypothetical protein